MKYQKIWDKVLNQNEKIKYEFSIGKIYRHFNLLICGSLGILMLIIFFPIGIIYFLFVVFYFGWYLEKANAYAFTDRRILIHKGWLSTSLISVDYQKITDIKVKEPFFYKLLCKSGYLLVNTAGTGTHEIILEHIQDPYEVKKKLDNIR